jgi:hypothetical protein
MSVSKSSIQGLAFALTVARAAAAPVIDSDIAEAVFRYQFAHNESMAQSGVDVYCVAYVLPGESNLNPPAELIARLSGGKPQVVEDSRCPCKTGVRNTAWISFRINSVTCSDANTCQVEGGYYENPESASGNTYFVEKHDGNWVVTRDEMHWIS